MLCCYNVQFQDDAVLIPQETAWFGYYPDGAFDPVLPPQKVGSLLHMIVRHDLIMLDGWMRSLVMCYYGLFAKTNKEAYLIMSMQTKLYLEDWIGLKTLEEAGRIKFVSVPGGHLGISKGDMKKYIVPYLEDKLSTLPHSISDLVGVARRVLEQESEAPMLDLPS
jgi:palmitoyl-protein thioesterase